MLKQLLSLILAINQPNESLLEQYLSQIQESQINHAQNSEDSLNRRLMEAADEKAKENIYSAIPIYRSIIINNGALKEEAIQKVGQIYKNLAFNKYSSEPAIEIAMNFYNEVIKRHQDSPYLAEAYLNSGRLICHNEWKKDFGESVRRLEKAYDTATDNKVKAEARWTLAHIIIDHAQINPKVFPLKKAEAYLKEVIKLVPESQLAEDSKKELKLWKLNKFLY